jgi:hypothetical protein
MRAAGNVCPVTNPGDTVGAALGRAADVAELVSAAAAWFLLALSLPFTPLRPSEGELTSHMIAPLRLLNPRPTLTVNRLFLYNLLRKPVLFLFRQTVSFSSLGILCTRLVFVHRYVACCTRAALTRSTSEDVAAVVDMSAPTTRCQTRPVFGVLGECCGEGEVDNAGEVCRGGVQGHIMVCEFVVAG